MLKTSTPAPLDQAVIAKAQALPTGLWLTCPNCHASAYRRRFGAAKVCPQCGYGLRLTAHERIAQLTQQFEQWDQQLPQLPTDFPGYADKRQAAASASGSDESVICGQALIGAHTVALGVMDSHYMMGSLGTVAGERLCRLFERATQARLPVVVVATSGGARMQEGIQSLMQMAKVSQAVAHHAAAGLLYIVVLSDPTMGGVAASFAMQGDIILAEPHSRVGFAGKRVIEATIHAQLPADFQRAEAVQKAGFIDAIVPRSALGAKLAALLALHEGC
ncbi:acetyl-CoA carboxylase carboxyltransferase subunit beta [Lacticaseibacillus baoqingensis]|uniref:Acetyl-coenzyme A carboxylase carboxyl transferase subunit beta n=1 Tax=Lacticaseibacillus baoqingensis TaxID=2486013 RepID=A0ABW4E4J1_9LACO|nr:acetyl-CoA carboxylase carboxyltransferase subunit beta [Lacticaseibacillus baoqingensis]